jgi:PEP-CTERM motif
MFRQSTVTRLARFAVLATAFLALTAVRARATTLTAGCDYSQSTSPAANISTTCDSGINDGLMFKFGFGIAVELHFDTVLQDFAVTIQASSATADQISSNFSEAFAGWAPVPICPACDDPYIVFDVLNPPQGGDGSDSGDQFLATGGRGPIASSGYDLYIYWLADTNALYPNPQMLHATGSSETFDQNIRTVYFSELSGEDTCTIFDICGPGGIEILSLSDPGVGGRDNMFTEFTLADATAVPEPASLILLGTGISTLMYRRRRQQK